MAWSRIDTIRGTSCRVLAIGAGEPVLYLHGAGGLDERDPFLARLAEHRRVLAPEHPGYGESTGEDLLEDMLDFTLHGWDVADALGLDHPDLVAHSMGGMIAAEMACISPERPRKLVLVAPAGLWLDDHPVPDVFATLPHDLGRIMFFDEAAAAAGAGRRGDFSDPEVLVEFMIGNAKRLGTAGKILFPIPNRRLSKRLYRLRAETLVTWGEGDRLYPKPYADRWAELVPASERVTIPQAGHMVTVEQPEALARAVESFLSR
ncbi:MAG: Hydrolase, alpha/beta fold family [uncultured Acidimicrobiales bacterium]|uniref:Hydrolase, alpha/beta fold family n=1 Tax=uncultured Acidimicrobiales bacterium TaxID=310071 RepID=A0A6J4GYJ8_9ACTN|nr:MAG: Hydrolase, alpha/beta fold family [uncultured Acidimicrobiales bacterium]